jgi:Protein of unknown function (DUF3703)
MSFRSRIKPFVDAEIAASMAQRKLENHRAEFAHLERAHILGQASTIEHVRTHCLMLLWSVRNKAPKEFVGQVMRIVGAATKTAMGWVPRGNTGGANVSPFKPMALPADLEAILSSTQ